MDHFEQTLADQITGLAESADPAGPQRVLRRLREETAATGRRPRRPQWFRRGLALGLGGAAAAAVAVFALNATGVLGGAADPARVASGTSAIHHQKPATMLNTWEPGQHCPGAMSASVSELAGIALTPIWLPGGDPSRVTDSWRCGRTPVVMVGDVQLSYDPGWGSIDVAKAWKGLIDDDGGYTTTIAGDEALIQPASATTGTRNQIMIVHDGTLVSLMSRADVPMSHLLNDAKALDFNRPVPTR